MDREKLKLKFVPKLPPKKQPTGDSVNGAGASATAPVVKQERDSAGSAAASTAKNNGKAGSGNGAEAQNGRSSGRNSNNNRSSNDNRRGGDRGGRTGGGRSGRAGRTGGRGKFVMPTGVDYFTGNRADLGLPTHSGIVIGGPSPKATPTGSGATNGVKTEVIKSESALKAYGTKNETKEENEEVYVYESDDDLEGLDVKDDAAMPEGEEVWPPAEVDDLLMGTEGLQPVSLPLGPRSTYVRRQLAAEPILASPWDADALDIEENEKLFLIQLPTSLQSDMAAHIRSKPHYQSVDLTEESFENGTDSRGGDDASRDGVRAFTQKKLGKMQLLKSGRVRIVSNEGKLYEVDSGLAVSFAQYLSAIDVGERSNSAVKSEEESSGVASAASSTDNSKKVMNIMGRITKKLVVSEVVIDDVPASADSAGSLTSRDASGSEMEMEDTESVVNTARNSSNSDRAAASNSKSGRRRASSKQLDLEVTDNIAKDATKTAKAKNSKRNVTFDGTA